MCQMCQSRKAPYAISKHLLHPIPVTDFMERVQIDLMGPLITSDGFKYIGVAVEGLSKWIVAEALRDASALGVARMIIDRLMFEFGSFKVLQSDNGKHFRNALVTAICSKLNIKNVFSNVYSPQTQGGVEKANRMVGDMLSQYVIKSGKDWKKWLQVVVFHYNTTPSVATGLSPYEVMYGRKAKLP